MTTEERLDAIEARLDTLRVPPVRDELLRMRDVHGARLGAIEARLTSIEGDIDSGFDRLSGWLGDIDRKLGEIAQWQVDASKRGLS